MIWEWLLLGETDRQSQSEEKRVIRRTVRKRRKKLTTNPPPWKYSIVFSSFKALSCAGDHSEPSFIIQYAGIAIDLIPALAAYSATIPTTSSSFSSGIHTNFALSDSNSFCGTSNDRSRLSSTPSFVGNLVICRSNCTLIVRRRVQLFLGLFGGQE